MIPRPIVIYCTRFLVFFFILGFFYTVLKNVAFYRRQSDTSALIFITHLDPADFQAVVPDRWKDSVQWEVLQAPSLRNIIDELVREINIEYFEERKASLIKVKVSQNIVISEPAIFDILVLKFQEVQSPFSYRLLGGDDLYQWLTKALNLLYGVTILLLILISWELVKFSGYLNSDKFQGISIGVMILVLLFSGLLWALVNGVIYIFLNPAPFYWSIMDVFEQGVAMIIIIITGIFIHQLRNLKNSGKKEIGL